MIDLATLVQRITGKSPLEGQQSGGQGIATGGEFAALVRLAAQTGSERSAGGAPSGLRLVVDNGTPFPAGTNDIAIPTPTAQHAPAGHDAEPLFRHAQPAVKMPAAAAVAPEEPLLTGPGPAIMPGIDAESEALASDTGGDEVESPDQTAGETTAVITPQDKPDKAQPAPILAAVVAPATPAHAEAAVRVAAPQPSRGNEIIRARATPATDASVGQSVEEAPQAPAMTPRAAAPSQLFPQGSASPNEAGGNRITSATFATPAPGTAPPAYASTETGIGTAPVSRAAIAGQSAQSIPATSEQTNAAAGEGDMQSSATPFRSIVEMLPPVIQTELGHAGIRGPAGTTGISTAQALGSQVIDMGVSGQWIDRMAREIASLANGEGHSRFTLSPPHLGRLQVDLVHGAEGLDVHLLAETDEAARRLSEGRPALHADARLSTINLGQITVEKANAPSEGAMRDQGQGQRDLAGQAQHQQQGDRPAQGRGSQDERNSGPARAARDQSIEPDEAAMRSSARGTAAGHVRFA